MSIEISITALLYLIAAIALAVKTFKADNSPAYARSIMRFCGFIALVLHAYVLFKMVFIENGINMGLLVSLSLVSWSVTLIVYLTSLYRPMQSLLIALFPLSAILVITSLFVNESRILNYQLTTGLKIHIVLSISAYSILFIATLQALLLSYQERLLFAKKAIKIINILPPLQVMEHLLLQFITVGFFLLSLSLASGLMFINDMFAQHLVHKTFLSILAWVIYGVLLYGRWFAGWRGRHITRWALGGFLVLLLAYIGTKFVLELILNRI